MNTGNKIIENEIQDIGNPRLDVEYYGADFPVDLLVRRMEIEDFIIPSFQREYVWKEEEASRFIESILMGLPTPALFLAKDKFSSKYLVIDGQQRLRTLQFFYRGYFADDKVFKLKKVNSNLIGLTYSDLHPTDRRNLDNSIIHCIIISDNYDPRGMFYLFERLNTTGTPLKPQEIRNALYHGAFSDLIQVLSKNKNWEELCGNSGDTAVQQELILRFLAFHFNLHNYSGNMVNFLNDFMLANMNFNHISADEIQDVFLSSINLIHQCFGAKAFYHQKRFNRILYDSLMSIVAKNFSKGIDIKTLQSFYDLLMTDTDFWSRSKHSTSNTTSVMSRMAYIETLYKKCSDEHADFISSTKNR